MSLLTTLKRLLRHKPVATLATTSDVVLDLVAKNKQPPRLFKGFQYTVEEGLTLSKRSHTEISGLIKSE